MKKAVVLLSALALGLVGCVHDRHHSRHHDHHYVSDEHPRDTLIIDRYGNRTYVREYDRDRRYPRHQNHMEPRFRGKAAESLGWNNEDYHRQRGY
ncbi:MAG TPA: hypothetical protein VNT99_02245 [Methylomirabilota bacterium]|nr:hypothetical protein [Methylomirabilota bacterium]